PSPADRLGPSWAIRSRHRPPPRRGRRRSRPGQTCSASPAWAGTLRRRRSGLATDPLSCLYTERRAAASARTFRLAGSCGRRVPIALLVPGPAGRVNISLTLAVMNDHEHAVASPVRTIAAAAARGVLPAGYRGAGQWIPT